MKLKEPYGLVLATLGKSTSNVPFMMPKRVAETDPDTQITDSTGSGPFIFKKDEWKPGEKAVYLKNPKYKPRAEPPSGFAGGKVVKVDRVEWIWIADPQTQVNALLNGEIDFIEAPPHDLIPLLVKDTNIKTLVVAPMGRQYAFRFNVLHKPFDNAKVRQAVAYALNQKDFLNSTIGDAEYYVTCKSLLSLRLAARDDQGLGGQAREQRRQGQGAAAGGGLRRHAGRADAVDRHRLAVNLAPVAKSLMEKAGLKVDLQAMDWQTLVSRRAKKDPPASGGWSVFLTSWGGGRRARSGLDQLPQRHLRQGDVRLAVRRRDRAPARRLRQGDRPRQAEGDRRGRVACGPPNTPPTSISGSTCSPPRSARTSRACWSPPTSLLEHREEVSRLRSGRPNMRTGECHDRGDQHDAASGGHRPGSVPPALA